MKPSRAITAIGLLLALSWGTYKYRISPTTKAGKGGVTIPKGQKATWQQEAWMRTAPTPLGKGQAVPTPPYNLTPQEGIGM